MTKSRLITQIDKLISEFVIRRDNQCVKCGNTQSLTCSHYFNRKHFGTRFHLMNLDTLCMRCHIEVEKDKKVWYEDYKKKQLGVFYEQLLVLKNQDSHFKMHELQELHLAIQNALDKI